MTNKRFTFLFSCSASILCVIIFEGCNTLISSGDFNEPTLNQITLLQGDSLISFTWSARSTDLENSYNPTQWVYSYDKKIKKTMGLTDGKPLEGKYVVRSVQGNLIEHGSFHKGLKEGKWMRWQNNGVISNIGYYDCGDLSGTYEIYDKMGRIVLKEVYKNGLLHGRRIEYNNGMIKSIQLFKRGRARKVNFISKYF